MGRSRLGLNKQLNFEGINFAERVEKGDHRPEKGKFGLCLLLNYLHTSTS